MPHLIRPATTADVAGILGLIRELAEYEKLSEAVVATEARLQEFLFGPDPVVESLIAEVEGKVVGYAIYFRTFSTFLALPGIYLEDLYVQPQHRRRGLGKALLAEICRMAVRRGYGRVEWSVLRWNTPSIEFYKSLGAEALEEWEVYRLTGAALGAMGRG